MDRTELLQRRAHLDKVHKVKAAQLVRLRRKRPPLLWNATALFPKQDLALKHAALLGESDVDEQKNFEILRDALEPCLERPQSLDPVLKTLCRCLIKRVESPLVSRALYLLCIIRGRKAVAKQLPSEVAYLEPCLALLKSECWETRYVALVWLSTLCLIPFSLDSVLNDESPIDSIQRVCEQFLMDSKPTREPAALCLARLLTRVDAEKALYCFLSEKAYNSLGHSIACAEIVKRGCNGVAQFAKAAIEIALEKGEDAFLNPKSCSSLERKLHLKIIQRYFLAIPDPSPKMSEDVLGLFIGSGLSDGDSVVRWSAAKGVARVAMKLALPEMQKHICESVLSLLEDLDPEIDDDTLWHGASLCLGELARNRLINSSDLVQRTMVSCVARALEYDRRRGSRVLGSNVRDSACFVAWALVRAVKPNLVQPCADRLYRDLVLCALFDREVTCRRAAAAALQECVGRLGRSTFPRGIETIQLVDFQSMGNMQRSYEEIAPRVAQLENSPDFPKAMLDHLVNFRLLHWDEHVRILSAKALGTFVSQLASSPGKEEWIKSFIAELVGRVSLNSSKVQLHGALLGLANVAAIAQFRQMLRPLVTALPELQRSEAIQQADELRFAVLLLIEALCNNEGLVTESDEAFIDSALNLMIEAAQERTSGQIADQCLVTGARLMLLTSFDNPLLHRIKSQLDSVPILVLHSLLLANSHRCGWLSQAEELQIGALLLEYIRVHPKPHVTYENRVLALRALQLVSNRNLLIQALAWALCDYEVTVKGDVGSWVRREGCRILESLGDDERTRSSPEWSGLEQKCAFLACEKLDHVREAAQTAMKRIRPDLSKLEVHEQPDLTTVRTQFEYARCLLDDNRLRDHVLRGFALTGGGLTESTSVAAKTSLLNWFTHSDESFVLFDVVLDGLRREGSLESRSVPYMKTLAWLLMLPIDHARLPRPERGKVWCLAILDEIRRITLKTKSAHRLLSSADVIVALGGPCEHNVVWSEFGRLLSHAFPVVRKHASEAFYLWAISVLDPEESSFNIFGGNLEAASEYLSEQTQMIEDGSTSIEDLQYVVRTFLERCPK